MKILNIPMSFFSDKIKKGEPVSFMRWGDGEMSAVLGKPLGATDANGHEYFSDLCIDLRRTLDERILRSDRYDYMLGMQSLGHDLFGYEWGVYIDALFGPLCGPEKQMTAARNAIKWFWTDVLAHAVKQIVPPGLLPLVKAIEVREVVFAGPRFLEHKLPFHVNSFVPVPEKNCYMSTRRLVDDITHEATKYSRPVILLSCGMPSKVIMHTIYPYFKLWGASILDLGSLWDVFAGRRTRSYQNEIPLNILEIYQLWLKKE